MKETRDERYLRIGTERLAAVRQVRSYLVAGLSWKEIGYLLKPDWQTLRKWHLRNADIPTAELTPAHFYPRTHLCGRKPKPAQP